MESLAGPASFSLADVNSFEEQTISQITIDHDMGSSDRPLQPPEPDTGQRRNIMLT